jgi:uncharacterized protein YggT (Ycf19 family)
MTLTTPPQFLITFITLATNLVEGLLSLRIVLKLFGASTNATFVRWVYETTDPLLTPFIGMFPSPTLTDGVVIEFSSLFALMAYAFIGYILIEIMNTLIYQSNQRIEDHHSRR